MPYSQRFVASVVVDGQVQKESPDGSVEIPFGSEYTLRFRNKHRNRRAVVKLWIDGEEQSIGGYVIPPSSFKDIERNSHSPHRFKLVNPHSADAQAHGKDEHNVEGYNGVVEARFYLEKEQPQEVHHHHHHHHDHYHPVPRPPRRPPWQPYPYETFSLDAKRDSGGPRGQSAGGEQEMRTCSTNAADYDEAECAPEFLSMGATEAEAAPKRASAKRAMRRSTVAGVTVEGSRSSQTFRKVDIDLEEQFTPIKLILKGYHAGPTEVDEVEVLDDADVVEATSKKA